MRLFFHSEKFLKLETHIGKVEFRKFRSETYSRIQSSSDFCNKSAERSTDLESKA